MNIESEQGRVHDGRVEIKEVRSSGARDDCRQRVLLIFFTGGRQEEPQHGQIGQHVHDREEVHLGLESRNRRLREVSVSVVSG